VSNSPGQYLNNTPGKHEIKELQKISAILGTGYILPEVLMLQYKTYFSGELTSNVAQIASTEQLQHYIP
jgi:hypothetical protein